MAIEELSKEMGLTCIKAYKLDALRSVKIKEEDIEVDALAHSVHEISCNNARDTRTTGSLRNLYVFNLFLRKPKF